MRRLLLLGLTLGGLALRFWRLGEMPLFGDEAYYLLWADRLAPAYFDHGAAIALLLKLSTSLAGIGEMGVRWLNALLSTACIPLAWAVGRCYVSARGGLIAAAAVAFGPVYVITGRVVYPDTLHDVLLLLSLSSAAPLLIGPAHDVPARPGRWALFGLVLALMLNVKLSTGFFLMALALYVLAWRRDLLRRPGSWLAVGAAALGAAPIVAWNLAHDWGTVRLALAQGANYGLPAPPLPATWLHAVRYLTPPVAGLAFIAAGGAARRPHQPTACAAPQPLGDGPRLLAVAAVCLLLPILLSAANSPRNLGLGLLPLWPLAGLAPGPLAGQRSGRIKLRIRDWAVGACLAGSAIYAIGTVAALLGPSAWPSSSGARAIRADATPWPALARAAVLPEGVTLFAVDYNIAGQIAYYTGRPVYSAAPQFRAWGIPESGQLLVLSLGFAPDAAVAARLRDGYARVERLADWQFAAADLTQELHFWLAEGRRRPMTEITASLDYLALALAAEPR